MEIHATTTNKTVIVPIPNKIKFTSTEEEVGLQTLEYDPSPCLYQPAKSCAAHLHQAQTERLEIKNLATDLIL